MVQLPSTTLGQETRWGYSATLPSPHAEHIRDHTGDEITTTYFDWCKIKINEKSNISVHYFINNVFKKDKNDMTRALKAGR